MWLRRRHGAEHTTGMPVVVMGHDLFLPAVVRAIVGRERSWNAVISFCDDVLSRKETAE